MLDPEGYVTTWNRGAERLKGYAAGEIIGRHCSTFYSPEDVAAGRPQALLERALAEGRSDDVGWRIRKDGTSFWADAVITAVYDDAGHHQGFAKVTRDLTERRRAEEERVRLAQMEEAVRLREEFMSVAAHELRTPLNALRLQLVATNLLLSKPGVDRGEVGAKVERALRQTERLGELIARLFDVSRLSRGRMVLERRPMDLASCVRDAIAALRAAPSPRRPEIRFRAPAEANGVWDPLRVEQVVANLLDNAVRYGEGAPIDVSVEIEDGFVRLDVVDAGPGVAADERAHLFERFGSGTARARSAGLGLGLYISRAIVEAHGGTIALENSAGRGAHFRVRLPADREGTGRGVGEPEVAGGEGITGGEGGG